MVSMKRTVFAIFAAAAIASAQQPFLTDDADTAPFRHFHVEVLSQFDQLQRLAYPTLHQSTNRVQVTYGLLERLEVGMDGPLLSIFNAANSGLPNALGLGDLDFQAKYRVHTETPGSRWPSFTMGLYIEVPTGDPARQLGSGVADYWLNGILQKRLSTRWTYRLNSGVLFSGNTLTGAIGIQSSRGRVYTGANSLTYQITPKWLIGAELAGAHTEQLNLGKSQLQALFGSKYMVNKVLGLDFALTGGKFEGSPRAGAAFGFSVDF